MRRLSLKSTDFGVDPGVLGLPVKNDDLSEVSGRKLALSIAKYPFSTILLKLVQEYRQQLAYQHTQKKRFFDSMPIQ